MNDFKKDNLFSSLFPEGKEWFSARSAGRILGVSPTFIFRRVYAGHIDARFFDSATPEGKTEVCIRIHKSTIVDFLLKTANHNTTDFLRKMECILSSKSDADKKGLIAILEKMIA